MTSKCTQTFLGMCMFESFATTLMKEDNLEILECLPTAKKDKSETEYAECTSEYSFQMRYILAFCVGVQ